MDFKKEVVNAERTRNAFKSYDDLYIPKNYIPLSGKRAIVMEFMKGLKITQVEELEKRYGDPKLATDILIDIFAKMIFKIGHVHCDAHPGNILVRPNPRNKQRPQIVLLDHGFYCDLSDKFRNLFCNLWYSMVTMDYYTVKDLS